VRALLLSVWVCERERENHSLVTRLWAGHYNVQILAGLRGFTILQNLKLDSGAHPVAYSVGTRVPSQEVNMARDIKFTTNLHIVLRFRMRGYTLLPMCLHGVGRDKLTQDNIHTRYTVHCLLLQSMVAVCFKGVYNYCNKISGSHFNPQNEFILIT